MKDKRILYVSSEVVPYLAENEVSLMSYDVPKMINDQGGQIRIFMPRYGNINERRHQLHEVIRLSGMNLVVNDLDMPLIIKVASIPKERIQVYFIDNDEYFKRKATFADEEGVLYPDNDERAIFFAKGVVETVKKLNWVPDIIHVHGWLAAMLPIYMKHYYKHEALFSETKIITSVYGQSFDENLDLEMINKVKFDGVPHESVSDLEVPNYENVLKASILHSDGVIIASENVSPSLTKFIESSGKPFYLSPGKMDLLMLIPISIEHLDFKFLTYYKTMINTSFIKRFLLALTVVFLYSCDKDFNAIGDGLIGDDHFGLEPEQYDVVAFNQEVTPVQSNFIPTNALGIYDNPVFGTTTANFVTQVVLSSYAPTIGESPVIENAVLTIPYFVKTKTTDADGASTYVLDSIYGDKNGKLDLKVYESGIQMRNSYFNGGSQLTQFYYTDQNSEFETKKVGNF